MKFGNGDRCGKGVTMLARQTMIQTIRKTCSQQSKKQVIVRTMTIEKALR